MAPVDEGDLEDAIKHTFRQTPGGYRAEIFVDEGATKSDGRSVFSYAQTMHDELEIGYGGGQGTYRLGPGSQRKDEHSEFRVGGKFMDRALEVREPQILREMDNTLRAATRSDGRKKDFKRLRNFTNLVKGLLINRP